MLASFFSNWITIAFTNWRFHCALKAQNDPLFTEIYVCFECTMKAPVGKGDGDPIAEEGSAGDRDQPVQYNWITIAFTNWRFHCALKAQNDPLFTEIYAWKSSLLA
jgi:amino acid permease